MTVSDDRTQRLPRDLALITLAANPAMFVIFMGYGLLHSHSESLGSVYTSAKFLIPELSTLFAYTALMTVLVWSLARNFLDKRVAAEQLDAQNIKSVFAAVYVVLSCGYSFGMIWLYPWLVSAILHSSWLEQQSLQGFSGNSWAIGALRLVILPIKGLIVFAAFWTAISLSPQDHTARFSERVSNPATSSSLRLVLALICGVSFASLHIWLTNLCSEVLLKIMSGQDVIQLAGIWIALPMVLGVLVFLGAWLGVSHPVQARPFRALAATVLVSACASVYMGVCVCMTMVLHLVMTGVHVFVWFQRVLGASGSSNSSGSAGTGFGTFIVVAIVPFVVLLVPLTFGITRLFYRSLQVAGPNSRGNAVQWPS